MAGRYVLSPKRRGRVELARRYKAQGLTSQSIGQRMAIAQRQLGVTGVTNPSGVYPVTNLKASGWKKGGPHRGAGATGAYVRGVQVRALIGYYSRH